MSHSTFGTTKGVVLAGTHPWNNSLFEQLAPRPLLLVAHRPLVSYALSWLQAGGICDAVLCTNRETRGLQRQLAEHIPKGMTPSYHEDTMPRGSAGCVRDASAGTDAETFVVADGNAIPTVDLDKLLSSHHASGAAITVVVHQETPRNGETARQVPHGIYVFARRALDAVRRQGFVDIKENLIPLLYESGEQVFTFPAGAESLGVLDAPSYLAVNDWMVRHFADAGERPMSYFTSGRELIDRSASIDKDAVLVGPVLIGPRVRVLAGATIVGPTSIAAESIVDCGAVVSRSSIWRRCVIGRGALADRSILGDDSVVEPGSRAVGAVRTGNRERRLEESRVVREFPSVAALLRRRFASVSSSAEGKALVSPTKIA